MRQPHAGGDTGERNGCVRLIWGYGCIFLFVLCVLLLIFLVQTRRRLDFLTASNKTYSSVQKTFSKAVAGVEANLEKEKINTSRLLKILESIQDGVAIMDEESRLRYANNSLWRLYAIPPERRKNYMGVSWLELHSPKGQDEIRNDVFPALEKKGVWLGESDVLVHDGNLIRAELFISKVEGGYIGFIRDVTDRYRAERERENLTLQMHQWQKSQAVERVVRALVHEFNNGLSTIIGFSEMLRDDLKDNAHAREYADKVYYAGRQMQGVLEQTRLVVPEDRPGFAAKSDLVSLVPSAIGELRKRIAGDFRIVEEISLEHAAIDCDAARLSQLLQHILKNAIEANAGRARDIRLHISSHKFRSDVTSTGNEPRHKIERIDSGHIRLSYGFYETGVDYAEITVADQGAGITMDVMEHILDPFFSTKKISAKAGLGMSIVKSILQYNKGYMIIDSISDKGTTLTILLPLLVSSFSGGFHSTIKPDRQAAR